MLCTISTVSQCTCTVSPKCVSRKYFELAEAGIKKGQNMFFLKRVICDDEQLWTMLHLFHFQIVCTFREFKAEKVTGLYT